MEAVTISKHELQDIMRSIKITFYINFCVIIFIYVIKEEVNVFNIFLAAQSIGLTFVSLIQLARLLYKPFRQNTIKLYLFLPVPIVISSLIGINFLPKSVSLLELILLVSIIAVPIVLLFQYIENKHKAKEALDFEQHRFFETDKALLGNKLLLQAQLNPHFLFNTLESIKQYIDTEPEKATQLLTDYTLFLRHIFPSSQSIEGTVQDELRLIRAYITIQQSRFPHIRFVENIEKNLYSDSLLPLLVQPLIENAIVHGLAPLGHQGIVTLNMKKESRQLIIEVIDTGVGFDNAVINEHSLAINNIKDRLELHHPGSTFQVMAVDQGTKVQLIITLDEL